MNITEEHLSPDNLLRLVVTREQDGDVTVGFYGYAWHTHADILASLSGLPEGEAVRQFVDRIITGEQVIAVSRVNGVVCDVWPSDEPLNEFRYKPPEESIEFRRWNGEIVPITPPDKQS